MKTYIENLKTQLENSKERSEQSEIIKKFRIEKEACKKILDTYIDREERIWIKCIDICENEKNIIKQIDEILYTIIEK